MIGGYCDDELKTGRSEPNRTILARLSSPSSDAVSSVVFMLLLLMMTVFFAFFLPVLLLLLRRLALQLLQLSVVYYRIGEKAQELRVEIQQLKAKNHGLNTQMDALAMDHERLAGLLTTAEKVR